MLSFRCLFVRSIWILGLNRYYINTIHCAAISTSVAAVGSPMLYSCRKEMVLTNRIGRIFPVQSVFRKSCHVKSPLCSSTTKIKASYIKCHSSKSESLTFLLDSCLLRSSPCPSEEQKIRHRKADD